MIGRTQLKFRNKNASVLKFEATIEIHKRCQILETIPLHEIWENTVFTDSYSPVLGQFIQENTGQWKPVL